MDFNNVYFANNTTVGSGAAAQEVTSTVAETTAPAPAAPVRSNSGTQMILTMLAVFAVMYFFTIRPQRKKAKELAEIQSQLKVGDWVMTFSGMYGKVADIGADTLIVEFGTNKGVRIPIRKADVTKSQEPVLYKKEETDEGQ